MNQHEFIERRYEEWEELEHLVATARKKGLHTLSSADLARIGPLYRKVNSDLSLARLKLSGSPVIGHLNHLIAQAHALIYGGSRWSRRGIARSLGVTFPRAVRQNLTSVLVAALVFAVAAIAGAWGWAGQDDWVLSMIPAGEQEWLREASGAGEGGMGEADGGASDPDGPVSRPEDGRTNHSGTPPTAPFDDEMKPVISSAILVNNVRVSFLAFGLGITFGIGTLWVVWINGLLLGALAWVYATRGLSLTFWALILPHGVLELPAIFLSAGAGLVMGWALLRPGDLRRADSLKRAGRRVLPLMGGSVILLAVAAGIEGFFTPSDLSPRFKLIFSALLFAVLFFYLLVASRWAASLQGRRALVGSTSR